MSLQQTLPDWINKVKVLECELNRTPFVANIKELTVADLAAAPALMTVVKTAREFDDAIGLLYSLDAMETIKPRNDPSINEKIIKKLFPIWPRKGTKNSVYVKQ